MSTDYTKNLIPIIRKVMPAVIAQDIVVVQPMGQAMPETWQSYLRRLSNGINGISERSKVLTAEDIIANTQKHMQIKYPGPYTVEQFYNAEKMKWDVRLKFDDPKQEIMWMLKHS